MPGFPTRWVEAMERARAHRCRVEQSIFAHSAADATRARLKNARADITGRQRTSKVRCQLPDGDEAPNSNTVHIGFLAMGNCKSSGIGPYRIAAVLAA